MLTLDRPQSALALYLTRYTSPSEYSDGIRAVRFTLQGLWLPIVDVLQCSPSHAHCISASLGLNKLVSNHRHCIEQ